MKIAFKGTKMEMISTLIFWLLNIIPDFLWEGGFPLYETMDTVTGYMQQEHLNLASSCT